MPGPRPRTGFCACPLPDHPRSPRARRPRPRRHLHRRHRRAAAAAALAALLTLATGGCAAFDATFGQQEAVVQFKPGTTQATRLQVRAACSRLPQARPEPLPTDHLASDRLYDVRYQVGGASDAQLAKLQQCLQRFPAVVGIDFAAPGGD